MPGAHRIAQINELIAQELSSIILREVEFPEHSLVTITRVDTDSDIANALVYVSIHPEDNKTSVMGLLRKSAGHLQRVLIRTLSMQHVPRISFRYYNPEEEERDQREEHALEHVLDLIKENKI